MRSASKRRYDERHRYDLAAKKRADRSGAPPEPRLPFDDLELSAWTVSLLRRHLSPEQFERMRGVLMMRLTKGAA